MLGWLQAGFAERPDINTLLSQNSFHLYSNQSNTQWLLLVYISSNNILDRALQKSLNTVLRNAGSGKRLTCA